jgi:hypothetical protein
MLRHSHMIVKARDSAVDASESSPCTTERSTVSAFRLFLCAPLAAPTPTLAMDRTDSSAMTTDTPISFDELFAIVSAAASQNPNVMLAAGTRLKECLKLSGTLNGLHQIASQKTIPLQIRQLSIIQCKNEIPTQWRQRKCVYSAFVVCERA